jgi:hypothetical protein
VPKSAKFPERIIVFPFPRRRSSGCRKGKTTPLLKPARNILASLRHPVHSRRFTTNDRGDFTKARVALSILK